MATRYFEDLRVGSPREIGRVTVTAEEIVEFAERYDPLPMHTDPGGDEGAYHEGLIASGYQTLCLANRVVAEESRSDMAAGIGIGIEDVRWRKPVRPGDELRVEYGIADKRVSESDPSRGVVSERVVVRNQDGDVVLTCDVAAMVDRRPDAGDRRSDDE